MGFWSGLFIGIAAGLTVGWFFLPTPKSIQDWWTGAGFKDRVP
jgi:hypothetical protein